MTEVVVPRPAQVLATLPVIMRHASHPVLVHHLRMGAPVLVLGPIWPDVQPLLRSQPGYQHFLCKIRKIVSPLIYDVLPVLFYFIILFIYWRDFPFFFFLIESKNCNRYIFLTNYR